ncbi:hypothetical protein ABPG77_010666 [Micractinium sp. CCAP 211/92]
MGESSGRHAVTLVCKRFRACFYSCPALWQRFKVDPHRVHHCWTPTQLEWLETRHAVLRRVAQHVAWFELHPGMTPEPFDRLAAMLSDLRPSMLRTLWLLFEAPPPAALFQLAPRFSQLATLDVRGRALPAAAADALRALPLLQSMSWCCDAAYPPAILTAIAGLGQLTKLSLVLSVPLPPEQAQLTALTSLQDLTLMVARPGADWAPPPPSAFASLRAYNYDCQEGSFQLAGAELSSCELLELTGGLSDCCGGNAGGEQLGMLLRLRGLQRLPPLGPFLAALQPLGGGPILRMKVQSLESTLIEDMEAAAAAAAAPSADHLHGLWLVRCYELGGLLRQAPRLRELVLRYCCEGSRPGCITSLRGLRRLHATHCELGDLPAGNWLAGEGTAGISRFGKPSPSASLISQDPVLAFRSC